MIQEAVKLIFSERKISLDSAPVVQLEIPKRKGQGDYASSFAMSAASVVGLSRRELAQELVQSLKDPGEMLKRVEVAGPGFVNFTIKPEWWRRLLPVVLEEDKRFGMVEADEPKRIQIEFVSANPTGPLHVGHGRWAAVGNAMANLLRSSGHDVQNEYYINDAGRQVKLLGQSVYAKYQQLCGKKSPDPEDAYRGTYITDLAERFLRKTGREYEAKPMEECLPAFIDYAVDEMLMGIRSDLDAFGVQFDSWFHETSLFKRGEVVKVLEILEKKGYEYERDGALWFQSTAFSDDKDRVIRKEDGEYTYLASDMAYHRDKLNRGFDQLINIWGADHHGYVARIEAVIQALGYPKEKLITKIGQLVTLTRGNEAIAMSKRSGEYITLKDVIDEVGKDAALFFFLMRRLESALEFDLELAKRQSNENPVYYVQYAHARLSSVLGQVEEKGLKLREVSKVNLDRLVLEPELALIRKIMEYPELIEDAAAALEPHRITFYLQDLAGLLHHYYFQHRIISDDDELTQARLVLIRSIRVVIRNGLGLLGISAPNRM